VAFSQTDLDALDAALRTGSTRVRYADREIQYRSLAELQQLRNIMRRELGQVSNGASRRTLLAHDKGT
jgi:hypothetical protein